MRRKGRDSAAYKDTIKSIGAPNKTVTDNAQVLTGTKCISINYKYFIETSLTIPHRQHQYHSEDVCGNIKFAILILSHNVPHAPYYYWYFAASFLEKAHRFLSQSTLDCIRGY